jgi:hypothetical protein
VLIDHVEVEMGRLCSVGSSNTQSYHAPKEQHRKDNSGMDSE